jgi:signal transduction histidine kinase
MGEGPPARGRHDRVLADIARFAGSSLELPEVLERIVERAAALTGADRVSILLLDVSGRRLLPSALWGMDGPFTTAWKTRPIWLAGEPLSQEALASGRPVVVADAPTDPRTDKRSVAFFGDRSILVAPLSRRNRNLGTLFLNHVRRPYVFTAEDVDTTEVIAAQAAIAIDSARLYGDLRRQAEQIRRSFRYAGEALAAGVDLHGILQSMAQMAVDAVGADGGSIRLLDESGRGTYSVASAGAPPPAVVGSPLPPAPAATALEIPLRSGGRPLGTLALWREAPPFTEQESELLASFAGHARLAIEHTRLYARLQEEQQRARQAERTQSDFVSMVSHELRTPLALVKAYVATLLQPELRLPPDRKRTFLEGIDAASDRLQQLIDNLLSATSLDAGLFVSQPHPLQVATLLEQAVAEATVLAAGRTVRLQPPPGDLWVLGDQQQLTQVIENLIGNAVKYAPGDSPVVVEARASERQVQISVIDSGPGIPPEALELVFEKFYRVSVKVKDASAQGADDGDRASAGAARRPGGIGLGLYICRRIVEAHGGRIWAENVPSGGAAFRVELPRGVGAGR